MMSFIDWDNTLKWEGKIGGKGIDISKGLRLLI